uniref:non-specific serine/threonine protein kinase n=1 Tax=Hirondellea gigas TaxID=1518452 RepID=A0A2P2I285_9CRUS
MDNYERVKAVGRGSYGVVHLYRCKSDGQQVVIKQITLDAITPQEAKMSHTEVKVLLMLQHPFIIQYHNSFQHDNAMMIVMEYAAGGNLHAYLQSRLPNNLLQEQDALELLSQLVVGLQHIHSCNILHRDLKTHNILLDRTQRKLKIGDFGISKILASKSKAHTVVGTPCYLSPELCQGKPYNQKSDIWALGCVLYELLSLNRAFHAETLPALILKITRGSFAPISGQYSAGMHALLQRLLHLDPAHRPSTNQIMADPVTLSSVIRLHVNMD